MVRKSHLPALAGAFLLVSSLAFAQIQADGAPDTATLRDGTPVRLLFTKTISSADAQAGDKISLQVAADVMVLDRVIIAKGGAASATVTLAEAHQGHGHDGQLSLHIDDVKLADGEGALVRARENSSQSATLGLVNATNSVATRESAMMQKLHGRDVAFLQGSEVTAYINGDTMIGLARFHPVGFVQATANTVTRLDISSWPTAAEISVDDSFVSNTPAVITVSGGQHTVEVRMAGYGSWHKTIVATGGVMRFDARLAADGVNGSTVSTCWGSSTCQDNLGGVARAYKAQKEAETGAAVQTK
jgi:hypothetical protein